MLSKSEIKYIQSFVNKRNRDEEGLFLAEGNKLVLDLLTNKSLHILKLYAREEWLQEHVAAIGKTPFVIVTEADLERISLLTTPQSVIALVKKPFNANAPVCAGRFSVALDTIQDPGNLGTIIRIADWYGVQNIICSKTTVDAFNPKVVQATMGSIARVQLFYVDLFEFLPSANVALYATVLDGMPVTRLGNLNEGLFLIGNEGKGIDEKLLQIQAIKKITIPGRGGAESLNAAVATGIILSHVIR